MAKLAAFEDAEETDGWIPVEERLPPKEHKSYLVTYQSRNGRRYVKESYCEYVGESPKVAYWTKKNKGEVIAWRPLPEPYRPERTASKNIESQEANNELRNVTDAEFCTKDMQGKLNPQTVTR